MKPVLHVFARWWAEGPVKTRLAADLGQERAREIYRQLAERCWAGYEDPEWQRWLWVEPADRVEDCRAWLAGADRVLGQAGADLGARMLAAFEASEAAGAPWAAVAGTDAPELDAARIRGAAADLASPAGGATAGTDLALVPAHDGGYALLAARGAHPALFRSMPWSTDQVARLTLAAAAAADLRTTLLPPIADVDTASDLEHR